MRGADGMAAQLWQQRLHSVFSHTEQGSLLLPEYLALAGAVCLLFFAAAHYTVPTKVLHANREARDSHDVYYPSRKSQFLVTDWLCAVALPLQTQTTRYLLFVQINMLNLTFAVLARHIILLLRTLVHIQLNP